MMQTAFAQKKEQNKSTEFALSHQNNTPVDLKEERDTQAGVPFFLQRFSATSHTAPPPIQRQPIEKDEEGITQVNSGSSSIQRQFGEDLEETYVLPKLKIGEPDDEYERQADQVADKVMRMPDSDTSQIFEDEEDQSEHNDVIRTKPITPLYIQGKCVDSNEGANIQGKGASSQPVQAKSKNTSSPAKSVNIATTITSPTGGSSLPASVKNKVGTMLNADLGHVRIHNDTNAHDAAQQLNAKAFTHQNHIWLGKGQSQHDVSLMAHEATHVV